MGVASRWAKWEEQGRLASMHVPQTAGSPAAIAVEIFINSAWTDITPYVAFESRISITRGRTDETAATEPQKLTLTLLNRDGRFCDTNPTGPYYGQIGRNTLIRVSKVVGGSRFYRFTGEVVGWPQTFDLTGQDVRAPIEAAGIKRRLSAGNTPLKSATYRALSTEVIELRVNASSNWDRVPAQVIGYWPMEDQAGAKQVAAGRPGVAPMTFYGTPTFANNSDFISSDPLPNLGTGVFRGVCVPYTATGSCQARMFLEIPSGGVTSGTTIMAMYLSGTLPRVELYYGATANTFGIRGFDSTGTNVGDTGNLGWVETFQGNPIRLSVELLQVGGDIHGNFVWELQSDALTFNVSANTYGGAVWAGRTLGVLQSVSIAPTGGLNGAVAGHLIAQGVQTNFFTWYVAELLGAYAGEACAGRVSRLCFEEGISEVPGVADDPSGNLIFMGPQTRDTLVNLLQQCQDTDGGILYEPPDQLGIAFRPRWSLYNQSSSLPLDVSQHQLAAPLAPIPDDQKTFNDVTVQRDGGSSAEYIDTTSKLSVNAPPNGVGRYDTSYTLSLFDDTHLMDEASWHVHVGTVNEPRYPTVAVQLAHPSFATNYALTAQALTVDVGDRITIDNPPAPLPSDEISLLVQGYTEVFDQFLHEITFNCAPESPYRVAFADDPVYGRADTDGSAVTNGIGAADVTMSVSPTSSSNPLWTTSITDVPFDISVGGETMTVTTVTPNPGTADGTFEAGVTGWTPTAATFTQSAAQAHSGSRSGLLTVVGAPSQAYVRPALVAVVANSSYTLIQYVYIASGTPSVNTAIDWYDASQVYISSSVGPGRTLSGSAVWTLQELTAAAPANAAYATYGPTIYSSPAAGTAIYVDDITFQLVGGPQTFTVTRSVNGIVKPQQAGTDVRLAHPSILGL